MAATGSAGSRSGSATTDADALRKPPGSSHIIVRCPKHPHPHLHASSSSTTSRTSSTPSRWRTPNARDAAMAAALAKQLNLDTATVQSALTALRPAGRP